MEGTNGTSTLYFYPTVLQKKGDRKDGEGTDLFGATSPMKDDGNDSGTSEPPSLLETLNVNIVSIIIGALAFVVVISIVDFIKAISRGILEECVCGGREGCRGCKGRYKIAYRKGWVAIVEGLTAVFVCILVYMWYKKGQI